MVFIVMDLSIKDKLLLVNGLVCIRQENNPDDKWENNGNEKGDSEL